MTPREFAIETVEKLQLAGYTALWAGGCVRDSLLNREPKDYDVATSALPDQIRELFGQKKTLSIGASFGVITVLGPRSAGQIEVATFRRDSGYSDGRHPDSVEFTDAREDALRRDFTINGMFFDPRTDAVIDYVGGQTDLQHGLIRAIGNPHERIEEDKLRMLRGVRFAATFDFQIEANTRDAIREHATEIKIVSAERIGVELSRMLAHSNKSTAARLLLDTDLLRHSLPAELSQQLDWSDNAWQLRLEQLERLGRLSSNSIPAAIYLLLRPLIDGRAETVAANLQSAWRLKNEQRDSLIFIARNWETLAAANLHPWSRIQPLLIDTNAEETVLVAEAIAGGTGGVEFCNLRWCWTPQQLDPPPLLSGRDLIALGIGPSPEFKSLLQSVRDQQLDGKLLTMEEAKQWVLLRKRRLG